jgi:hypothetical protein
MTCPHPHIISIRTPHFHQFFFFLTEYTKRNAVRDEARNKYANVSIISMAITISTESMSSTRPRGTRIVSETRCVGEEIGTKDRGVRLKSDDNSVGISGSVRESRLLGALKRVEWSY